MHIDEITGRPRAEIDKEFDLMNAEIDARDRRRAARCYYCAMHSPRILLDDGMYGHALPCKQAVECGDQPSIHPDN